MSVLALAGGVGGAKLALGLQFELGAELSVLVNTADDFDHLGLRICPDLDTVMYTLAGMANREAGWGIANETWSFMEALQALGGETWFKLGDRDLATHVERTRHLAAGTCLTELTAALSERLGVAAEILPMSDDPVATVVETDAGELGFQDYFVRQACRPRVRGFAFRGIEDATPQSRLFDLLAEPALRAVIICPSNPFVSIGPILALRGVRDALRNSVVPVIAVSPIVGGSALKGPAAKMMTELGLESSAVGVAELYDDFLAGLIVDHRDADATPAIAALNVSTRVTNTVMTTDRDKRALAGEALAFASQL